MPMNNHDQTYKYFLKLRREWNKLCNERRDMPYVDVEPFQQGWICSVAVKPQYLTHEGLTEAVDIGYGYVYIKHVRDVKNIRKGLTRIHIGKIERNYFPTLKQISHKHYDSLSHHVKQWFVLTTTEKANRTYYVSDIKNYCLHLRVKQNIYTRVQQINPNIESRIKEIDEIFEQNCYWVIYANYHGWRGYNINLRQNFKNQLHKFKLEQIDNIENMSFKLGWN